MNAVLPQPHEAQQLCRLRGLRVQRAQEAWTKARDEVEAAVRKVRDSERAIERMRSAIDTLSHSIVNGFAPHLPRWAAMVTAQSERLADQAIERMPAIRELLTQRSDEPADFAATIAALQQVAA